jgi:hypothetical protein
VVASTWQFLAGLDWRFLVDVLSALLTPDIAGITVWIAYQQMKTTRMRLNFEQYERRLEIYKALDAFYGEIATHGKPHMRWF